MTPEIKLIIIISLAGLVGSGTRIYHERQKKVEEPNKPIYVILCTFFILIGIWYAPLPEAWQDSKVFISLLGGILSIDVVDLIITKGKGVIHKYFNKKLDIEDDK